MGTKARVTAPDRIFSTASKTVPTTKAPASKTPGNAGVSPWSRNPPPEGDRSMRSSRHDRLGRGLGAAAGRGAAGLDQRIPHGEPLRDDGEVVADPDSDVHAHRRRLLREGVRKLQAETRALRTSLDEAHRELNERRLEKEKDDRILIHVIDSAEPGLFCFDSRGDVVFMNQSARRLIGNRDLDQLEEIKKELFSEGKLRRAMKETKQKTWYNIFKVSKYIEDNIEEAKEAAEEVKEKKTKRKTRKKTTKKEPVKKKEEKVV